MLFTGYQKGVKKMIGQKKNERIWILIGIALICMVYAYPVLHFDSITVINDEFGYWGIAAFLSGNLWEDLLSITPYYSYGYSLLIAPLYLLKLAPAVIYKVALLENVLFIVLGFLISISLSNKFCVKCDFKIRWLICLVTCFYTNNIIQAQIAWTETILYFLFWLLSYILVLNLEKTTYLNMGSGIIVAIYMYCVHQRTIGIVLIYILLLIGNLIIREKEYKKVVVSLILLVTLFLLVGKLKGYIIQSLFTNAELVAMNNMQGQTSKINNILTTSSGMIKFIQSMLGKFYYISVASFYLIPIALCFCIKKISIYLKQLIIEKSNKNAINIYYLFVFLSFLSVFAITSILMYVNYGRLDLLIYGRYMEIVVGPLLCIGLYMIAEEKDIVKYIFIVMVSVLLCAVVVNYGLIDAKSTAFNSICATVLYYFFKTISVVPGIAYIITIIMLIPLLLLLFLKKKKKLAAGYIMVALTWLIMASFSGPREQQDYIVQNVIPIVKNLDSLEQYEIYFLDSDIGNVDGQTYIKYIQFFKPDINIRRIVLSDIHTMKLSNNSVIICDKHLNVPNIIMEDYEIKKSTSKLKLLEKRK